MVDPATRIAGVGTFLVLNGLDVSLDGLEGEVAPESVITTVKGMDQVDLPGGGGIRIQCGGSALPELPAVCSGDGLYTTLDAEGLPTAFQVTGTE